MTARSRAGSKLKTIFFLLLIPALFIVGMNLFWTQFSTTRVSIEERGIPGVKLRVENETIDLGDLRRGESRFMFLPKHGKGVYAVTYMREEFEETACSVEIDEKGYHVDVHLFTDRASYCTVTEPLFSDLLVTKFF